MGNHRSSGSFCSLVVSTTTGFFDSVAALNPTALGDGAECYCIANQSVYRLNILNSGSSIGDLFISPNSGPGRWAKQDAQAGYSAAFTGTNSFIGSTVTPTASLWAALPSSAGFYGVTQSSLLWTIDTTAGTMTYNGPTGKVYSITGILSLADSVGTPSTSFQVDLVDPSIIGTPTGSLTSTFGSLPSAPTVVPHQIMVTVTSGQVFQHAFRTSTVIGPFTFSRYLALIECIG